MTAAKRAPSDAGSGKSIIMKRVAVFPGQGAQAVGMGRALAEAYPAARAVFDEVDAALGEPLSALIFDGPVDLLTRTANAQPALMATSLAAVRAFEAEAGRPLGEVVQVMAGHSLGEYSALAAAGAITVGDAARLLRLRGAAMQAAVPAGAGAMAAIIGLDLATADRVVAEASAGDGVCAVANDNGAGQAVISGDKGAVDRALEIARANGARRSVLLQVSAPFHSPLMAPVEASLRAALERTAISAPSVPVIANVTAEPVRDPTLIPELLVRQVTARVRWRETMAAMQAMGIEEMIEFGAGKVLTGLARRDLPRLRLANVQGPADVEALAQELQSSMVTA